MGFLGQLHAVIGYLSFAATVVWAGAIVVGAGDVQRFAGPYRKIYLAMMATTGIAAVLGLIVTLFGPWVAMIFPWVGLVGMVIHNILGAKSKRALAAMETGKSLKLAVVMVVILLVVTGLMAVKPF